MDILSLPINIIIGNVISFFASIALILSCIVNDKREAYKYQVIEALIKFQISDYVHHNYPNHLPYNQYNGLDWTSSYDWNHTAYHLQLLLENNQMD